MLKAYRQSVEPTEFGFYSDQTELPILTLNNNSVESYSTVLWKNNAVSEKGMSMTVACADAYVGKGG